MSEMEILLYVGHSEMKMVPHLCLKLPVKEAYLPRPECGAVEIDWQLFSPVTTAALIVLLTVVLAFI